MDKFIKKIALEAGEMALAGQKEALSIDFKKKNDKDIVTQVDRDIETFLRSQIVNRFPEHAILGEEEGATGSGTSRWILDPIDGTVSFAHGQRNFSISIAYEENGELICGAVYAPAHGEFFYGEKGKGAWLNGTPIGVSSTESLNLSVLATGFACVRDGEKKNNLDNFCRILPQVRGIRRLGSAALDLAYVACGQFDGFWEMSLNLYDVAAGILLVREAGGKVSDFSGKQDRVPREIVACNDSLHNLLISQLK